VADFVGNENPTHNAGDPQASLSPAGESIGAPNFKIRVFEWSRFRLTWVMGGFVVHKYCLTELQKQLPDWVEQN
jgi:hypothetical protein